MRASAGGCSYGEPRCVRRIRRASWLTLFAALATLAACGGKPPPAGPPDTWSPPGPLTDCVAPRPGPLAPPGEQPGSWHSVGNGLWVAIGQDGVLRDGVSRRKDGRLEVKIPWWREVEGELKITGRRSDLGSGRLEAVIPAGYDSKGIQPSIVIFDGPGCWEVVGTVGNVRLSFVTEVEAPAR